LRIVQIDVEQLDDPHHWSRRIPAIVATPE
jgi:hypothetical protein